LSKEDIKLIKNTNIHGYKNIVETKKVTKKLIKKMKNKTKTSNIIIVKPKAKSKIKPKAKSKIKPKAKSKIKSITKAIINKK
jgi:hypothetical protein